MKYIVTILDGAEVIFVFPSEVDHDRMAEALEAIRFGDYNWERKLHAVNGGVIVSAGFININGECSGSSETLGINSRGDIDTKLYKESQ